MKYIWEESDVVAGVRFTHPGSKEVWIIGYRVDIEAERGAKKKYVQVSLNDGMCCCEATAEQLYQSLNEQGYIPKAPEAAA